MKNQLLTILLCLPLLGMAQNGIYEFGPIQNGAQAFSVKQTSDGGYITTGWFGYGGWNDPYGVIIKTNAQVDSEWSKNLTPVNKRSKGHEVIETTNGDFVVAGYKSSFGNSDFYLTRRDANGVLLWEELYGGNEKEVAYSVVQTTDGGFVMVGETSSYGNGQEDFWLVKTDANGVMLWDKTFGDTLADVGFSVKQTTDGGLIIAGSSVVPFLNPINGSIPPQSYLIKIDVNGNIQWEKKYFGDYIVPGTTNYSAKDNYATDVQQTADGGYILTGRYENRDSNSYTHNNMMLFKTDANGDSLWHKNFLDSLASNSTGSKYAGGNSVKQTADGGYIIVGWSLVWSSPTFFYVRTDANGNVIWEKLMNYSGQLTDVQLTSDGGYIMAGYSDLNGQDDKYILMQVDDSGNVTSTTTIPLSTEKGKLKKITNFLGQETKPTKNTPLLYQYENGTVEKKIIIE